MTTMTTEPRYFALRSAGRYRVFDRQSEDCMAVVTLNSKAKAEARAAELNVEHDAAQVAEHDALAQADAARAEERAAAEAEADEEAARLAEIRAMVDADVAMERAMDAECPQEDTADLADLQAEWDAHPEYAEAMTPAAEERQEEPAGGAGTSDTPAQEEKPQSAAEPVVEKPAKGKGKGATAPKADQPAPHAFTTVGTTVKNHCTECGRSWAAAAHRKFREAQQGEVAEVAEVATEGEWTPAADDTTEDGKAPAENTTV